MELPGCRRFIVHRASFIVSPAADVRRIAATAETRHAGYQAMVLGFYDLVTDAFESEWGQSQHCGLFATPDEPVAAAVARLEACLCDQAGITTGMRALDIGAGLGGPARHIARLTDARITAIDLSTKRARIARMLTEAQNQCSHVAFTVGDGVTLPFADAAFDATYTFEMGTHVPDKAALYAECARVLRPGGVFAGSDWFHADKLPAAVHATYIEPICRLVSIPNLISLADLRHLLAAAGFPSTTAGDLARHGDVTPNFERVSVRATTDLARADELDPMTLLLAEGGLALREAFRAGTFLMGYWIARRCA